VPWKHEGDHDAARAWALEIAERCREHYPELATVERLKSRREGRVYIDVVQNAKGHHVVPPFVIRPTACATVSMPLRWSDLGPKLDPRDYTVNTLFAHLRKKRTDPMGGLLKP
jgi:bifunctional non-homologous end joining protein LigD